MVRLLLIIIALSINSNAFSQYKYAAGVRFHGQAGVSVKNNKGSKTSLEGMLHGFGNGAKGTLLFEIHQKAFGTGKWRFYYGAGGHLGVASKYKKYDYQETITQPGLDGILGLEHTFTELPINISVDWKPEFNFFYGPGLNLYNVGFSARLAIL